MSAIDIGKRLQIIRGTKTVKEISKLAGISATVWAKYESGLSTPGGGVLANLSILGWNANWILTGVGSSSLDNMDWLQHLNKLACTNVEQKKLWIKDLPAVVVGAYAEALRYGLESGEKYLEHGIEVLDNLDIKRLKDKS